MSNLRDLWAGMYNGVEKTAASGVKDLDPVLLHSNRLSPEDKVDMLKEHLESRANREVPSRARAMIPSSLVGALLGGGGGALLGRSTGLGLKAGAGVGAGLGAALGALLGNAHRGGVQRDVHEAQSQLADGKHTLAISKILARLDAEKRQEKLDRQEERRSSQRDHEHALLNTKARAATDVASALGGGLRHFARGNEKGEY